MVSEGHAVQVSCRVADVSESGFYEWRFRPPSERTIRHAWLTDVITQVHAESNGIYGAPRVHAELRLGRGIIVGHNAVELLMAEPPSGVRPDGNAYRVEMAYQPSGTPVGQTTTSGNVIMIVPDEAKDMLFSIDGKSWDALPTHALGDPNTVGSAFNKPGYYLVGTELPEFVNPNRPDNTKRVAGIVLLVVAVALLLGYVLPTALRRSRAAQAAGGPKGRAAPPTRQVRRRKR